jgi:hypothetical protein
MIAITTSSSSNVKPRAEEATACRCAIDRVVHRFTPVTLLSFDCASARGHDER